MSGKSTPLSRDIHEELLRLYAEADRLVAGATCGCSAAKNAKDAMCCHFGVLGREPYVTKVEMAELARAVAARGGMRQKLEGKRRLPVAEEKGTCPLLSRVGRCTVYEARPLGCRTFFCEEHEGEIAPRKAFLDLSRRVADLSTKAFPRGEGPRPFLRALEDLGHSP